MTDDPSESVLAANTPPGGQRRMPKQKRTHQRAHDSTEISEGDRVRAKTTQRTGEVIDVKHDGVRDQVTVSYDDAPQDTYLTTPARDGAELPRELIDPA